jgi:hypothetical protein
MIRVRFFEDSAGIPVGFRIEGHSGAGSSGNDIVCSAVSSAAYLAANTVTDVIGADARVEARDGFMLVRVSEKDAGSCRAVLKGFENHMDQLRDQYPGFIHISNSEV